MRPLRRIFSISVADLHTIAIRSTNLIYFYSNLKSPGNGAGVGWMDDDREYVARHLVHRPFPIYQVQLPFTSVIRCHRPRLLVVSLQTGGYYVLAVIVTDYQLGAVHVAQFIHAGRLKVNVVDPSTGRTSPTSGEPTQQFSIIHVNLDHNRQCRAGPQVFKDLVFE